MSVGVPLAALTLAGHQSLGLITLLGAFTVLYGSTLRPRDRLVTLPLVGLGFVAASLVGALCAANPWLALAGLICVAAFASTLVLATGLGPPGPMQFVLVAAVSSHLVAPAWLGGTPLQDLLMVPFLVGIGALSAWLLVAITLRLPWFPPPESAPASLQSPRSPGRPDQTWISDTVRIVLAVAVAGLLGVGVGVHHAY